MARRLHLPVLSFDDLRAVADKFLERYNHDRSIPVPIEQIIDVHFRIDIVPLPGLQHGFEIDACVTSNLATIFIDEYTYNSVSTRYRFSLAHEFAHVILHRDIFKELKFSTVAQWRATVS